MAMLLDRIDLKYLLFFLYISTNIAIIGLFVLSYIISCTYLQKQILKDVHRIIKENNTQQHDFWT